MSRSDRIKEEIGWLKVVFAAVVAVDVSLVGWIAENYEGVSRLLVVCTFVGVVLRLRWSYGSIEPRCGASRRWRTSNGLVRSRGTSGAPGGASDRSARFVRSVALGATVQIAAADRDA